MSSIVASALAACRNGIRLAIRTAMRTAAKSCAEIIISSQFRDGFRKHIHAHFSFKDPPYLRCRLRHLQRCANSACHEYIQNARLELAPANFAQSLECEVFPRLKFGLLRLHLLIVGGKRIAFYLGEWCLLCTLWGCRR